MVEETQVLMRKIVRQVKVKVLIHIQCILYTIQPAMPGTLQFNISQVLIQHVETYDEENMRDFVDVYLREIASSKDPSFNGELILETPIPMKRIDQALLQRSSCW